MVFRSVETPAKRKSKSEEQNFSKCCTGNGRPMGRRKPIRDFVEVIGGQGGDVARYRVYFDENDEVEMVGVK